MSLKEKQLKMISKEIYDPSDSELASWQLGRIELVNEFNKTKSSPEGIKERETLYKKMFKEIGEGCYIEPPFHANLGGFNTKIGNYFYANFNFTLVDDGEITIGNNVLIGPNVTLATAVHPVNPLLRAKGCQYNLPIIIKNNVWLAAGVIVCGGVTIGENSIIGAGSVVTKDIPDNVIAFGNPCKVYRKITEEDYKTYNHGIKIPEELLK